MSAAGACDSLLRFDEVSILYTICVLALQLAHAYAVRYTEEILAGQNVQ